MQTFISKVVKALRINTINRKFLYPVIVPFILVVLVSLLINVQIQTSQGESELTSKVDTITKLASLSLVDPLWNYNNTVLENYVNALFIDKDVFSVVVKDLEGKEKFKKVSSDNTLKEAGFVSSTSSIAHEKEKLGTLEVKMSKYHLQEKINTEILFSIINNVAIIVLLIIIIALVSRVVVKPLKELLRAAVKISEGDYNSRSLLISNDEIGVLSTQFNKMAQNICDVLTKLQQTGSVLETNISKLKSTSTSITQISSNVYNSSGELASTAEELNATIEEISGNAVIISQVVSEVSDATAQTSINSSRIAEITLDGKNIISETIHKNTLISKAFEDIENKVKLLNKQSSEIKNFTNIIEGIASQTSLISLNAAIEAARAGELGKGFAVVADAIRKLSEQSSKATQEINQLINDIDKGILETVSSTERGSIEVRDGVELTMKAGESLDRINEAITEAILLIKEIEQKSRSADHGVKGVAKSCEDFATAVEHVALSAQELSKAAERMHQTAVQNNAAELV
ncbi:MAG: methyl-accepting chemotaxis protein [Clostridia bacterium]|nr:methyl-accepting chemotaxis protein [Clostridia bacterium]